MYAVRATSFSLVWPHLSPNLILPSHLLLYYTPVIVAVVVVILRSITSYLYSVSYTYILYMYNVQHNIHSAYLSVCVNVFKFNYKPKLYYLYSFHIYAPRTPLKMGKFLEFGVFDSLYRKSTILYLAIHKL